MKIWILKPADCWAYCGGAAIIIADSIQQVEQQLKKDDSDSKVYTTEPLDEDHDWYKWVVVETFDTTETEVREVLVNYNWG